MTVSVNSSHSSNSFFDPPLLVPGNTNSKQNSRFESDNVSGRSSRNKQSITLESIDQDIRNQLINFSKDGPSIHNRTASENITFDVPDR